VKKLTLMLIAFCMLFSTTYAYNLTKVIRGTKLITVADSGDKVTVRYNDIVGYTFNGWTATGITLTNPNSKSVQITMPENNVTLTANMGVTNYSIVYNLQGGTGNNPTSYTIIDTVTLTAPVREGYIFTGWTGSNGMIPQKTVIIPKGSTGSKLYTANWIENSYTLTTTINNVKEVTTREAGESITLNANTEEGYVFTGWDALGITLEDTTLSTITFIMPENDVEIKATYLEAYTLTTIIDDVEEITQRKAGESVTVIAVTSEGCTFVNWNATGITLEDTTSSTITFIMPENNVEIEAIYHLHDYDDATCTEVARCSICGATSGSALGHDYGEATCTDIATCKRCGATSGSALGHSYKGTRTCNVNGSTDSVQCIRCSATENQTCIHTYTITAGPTTNGTITLSATTVLAGGSATATITPNDRYLVSGVTVNGTSKGTITSYTFSNVTSNQTINATFSLSNVAPNTPKIKVVDWTTTTITFDLSGTDPDGDTVTYDVYVGGSKNGSTTLSSYTASGLTHATKYEYYVIAKDPSGATATSIVDTQYTNCNGTGRSHSTSSCDGKCYTCSGTGSVICTETELVCEYCYGYGTRNGDHTGWYSETTDYGCEHGTTNYAEGCSDCSYYYWDSGCHQCGTYDSEAMYSGEMCQEDCPCDGGKVCSIHFESGEHTTECTICNGEKWCTHKQTTSHRYCDHYSTTTLTSHTYCKHDKMEEHPL